MRKYHIIEVDGKVRRVIDIQNHANNYGTPKEFTLDEAYNWIDHHTYKGMSFHYEMELIKL